jgi:hypothetical protein
LAHIGTQDHLIHPRGGPGVSEQLASAGDSFPLELSAADRAFHATSANKHERARLAGR